MGQLTGSVKFDPSHIFDPSEKYFILFWALTVSGVEDAFSAVLLQHVQDGVLFNGVDVSDAILVQVESVLERSGY